MVLTRNLESAIFTSEAYEYAAAACQSAAYTVSALLYFACMFKSKKQSGSELWLNIILTAMFLLATVNTIVHLQFFRLVLVEHASNPGYARILNTPFHFISNLFMGLSAVLSDALMVWRLFVVWNRNLWIIIIPTLLTMATFADTIVWVVDISRNDIPGYINIGFSVIPVSVATNILVTILIAGRILWGTRAITGAKTMNSRLYSWIVGILIESAALYAVTGIATVVTFVKGSPSEQIMISFYMIMPSIAAFLIVLRVRLGLGYENVSTQGTSVATLVTAKNSNTHELSTVKVSRTTHVKEDDYYNHSGSFGRDV